VEPGEETPNSPAQRMALPGFAFVTPPPPKRSRRRFIPVAMASTVAVFLLYGVMDENHSTRVNVAERAQVSDVRIDPDNLPVALVQYPATVTGQTSDGQNVRCTIRSLHDEGGPSCVIPPSTVPHPQVPVEAPVVIAPPTSQVTPSTHEGHDARVTKSPVAVPPVKITTPPITTPPITTPPITTPPVTAPPEHDHDGHHRHHGHRAGDDQDGRRAEDNQDGRRAEDNQDGRRAEDNQDRRADDNQDGQRAEGDQDDDGHRASAGAIA
jgi:hypothetical protein